MAERQSGGWRLEDNSPMPRQHDEILRRSDEMPRQQNEMSRQHDEETTESGFRRKWFQESIFVL